MRRVTHTFDDGQQFLANYTDQGRREELFLPGAPADCAAGEQIDLEVRFAHSVYSFRTLAQVMVRRLPGRAGENVPMGTLVALIGPPHRRGMVAHARGEPVEYRARESARVTCHFPVMIGFRRSKTVAEAVDLSVGGVQVLGGPELEVGDAVQLRLLPADSLLGVALLGRVVWVQKQPELAYGIQLRPGGNRVRRQLEKLHRKLLARDVS